MAPPRRMLQAIWYIVIADLTMSTDNVLAIGGDSGLRGFKTNAFTGNKSVLLNLESRCYYPDEVLHLAYIGGAVFIDADDLRTQIDAPRDLIRVLNIL